MDEQLLALLLPEYHEELPSGHMHIIDALPSESTIEEYEA